MENKINVQKALEFLLTNKYFSEFSIIDKLNQHPDGINYEEWLKKEKLLETPKEPQRLVPPKFPDDRIESGREVPHSDFKSPTNIDKEFVKQQLSELEKYKAVNTTRSLKELSEVILSFADENGMIQGRERKFPADWMAENCLNIVVVPSNTLTRMYGIRQQALYLLKYGKRT